MNEIDGSGCRTPPPAHLANFRDVGGLSLREGGETKYGVLYRSDAPSIGDGAPPGAMRWPPAVVVDLRSEEEVAGQHDWAEQTQVHAISLLAGAAPLRETTELSLMYMHVVKRSASKVANLVEIVADSDGPVLIHCTSGKDRTGVAIAILLLAVGVEPAQVLADFSRTEKNMPTVAERIRQRHNLPDGMVMPPYMLETPIDALQAALSIVTGGSEGVAGWLVDNGANRVNIVKLKLRLTATQ